MIRLVLLSSTSGGTMKEAGLQRGEIDVQDGCKEGAIGIYV